jgi:hypothetical protein
MLIVEFFNVAKSHFDVLCIHALYKLKMEAQTSISDKIRNVWITEFRLYNDLAYTWAPYTSLLVK